MGFTLRMMRLLWIVPWMGIAAAATANQDDPRPAEAVFTHFAPARQVAWRIGNECFVPVDAVRAWGWSANVERFHVDLTVDGRAISVPYRTQAAQTLIPLGESVRKLGGGAGWRLADHRFEVWGIANRIAANERQIELEASLAVRPEVTLSTNPPRVVVDLHGLRMGPATELSLGPRARAAQYGPNVVRIVVETTGIVRLSPGARAATNRFVLRLLDAGRPESQTSAGERAGRADPLPDSSEQITLLSPFDEFGQPMWEPFDREPPGGGRAAPFLGSLIVESESPRAASLRLGLTAPLSAAPRFSRPEPATLEIFLPGARLGDPTRRGFSTASIRSVDRVQELGGVLLRLNLARPMGVELSNVPGQVHIALVKPQVGDGKLAGKIVVVDAGHGGDDTGARSPDKTLNEKDLALAIAKLVTTQLANEGATVIMTRKTDVRIPLKERSEIANRNGALFFVSVHINSNLKANKTSGGITFYHMQSPLGMLLAECVQSEIAKVSGLPSLGAWSDQRIYDSGFAVLRYSTAPAVLLELGFINHWADRKRMVTPDFQRAIAKAVVRGLKVYLGDDKEKK